MLKFERLGQEAIVSIRLKSRSSIFDRALLQALLWSLLFHLVLFGTFRIRYNNFLDSAPRMSPIAVAIEPELQDVGTKLQALADVEPTNPSSLFIQSVNESEWKSSCIDKLATGSLEPKTPTLQPSNSLSALTQADVATLQKTLNYAPKLYPLQLKLSRSLKALSFTDDGSSLFRCKGPHDDLGRLALSTQHHPIEYKIKVDGATGRIVHWDRKYELLDKELQKVADLLITKISFAPITKKNVKGSLTLNFCCSGEEIQELLND